MKKLETEIYCTQFCVLTQLIYIKRPILRYGASKWNKNLVKLYDAVIEEKWQVCPWNPTLDSRQLDR